MKTRTGLQLSEGEGVLSVANGGTGQSNLDNVTVGNAGKATQDANSNVIDTTYATKTELGEAVNSKQDKTDNALSTTQKTIVGAINENKSAIDNLRDNATKVSVGTTTTGEPGSQASVTNSGTDSNVVLDFAIPQGEQGPQGLQGEQGIPGPQGPAGADGADGADGTTFTPSVDSEGNLSWSNTDGKPNPMTVNIKGPAGDSGLTAEQLEKLLFIANHMSEVDGHVKFDILVEAPGFVGIVDEVSE